MRKKTIYLAGPIDGISYPDAMNWRKHAKTLLCDNYNIYIPKVDHNLTPQEIWKRDYFMLDNSDIILVNFDYDIRPFIGSSMEIGRAHYQNKPIIAFSSKEWVKQNKSLQYHLVTTLNTLEEAVDYINCYYY